MTLNKPLLDTMTLEEIKTAVRNGGEVYWKSHIYPVTMTKMQNGKERWLIECKENDSRVGLTWQDGKTMNGEEEDFHAAPYPKPHPTE